MKQTLPLSKAQRAAEQIVDMLKPLCERIEIVGSIRRGLGICGDIDLVCMPADERALRDRITTNKEIIQNGPQNVYVRLSNGIEVNVYMAHNGAADLFRPTPCNFGTLMVLRTGPRAFNIALVEYAKTKGMSWNPYHGVFFEQRCVASETEEDIFRALELQFIPPNERDTARTTGFFPFRAFQLNPQSAIANPQ